MLIAKMNEIICQKQQIYTSLHTQQFILKKGFKNYQSGPLLLKDKIKS